MHTVFLLSRAEAITKSSAHHATHDRGQSCRVSEIDAERVCDPQRRRLGQGRFLQEKGRRRGNHKPTTKDIHHTNERLNVRRHEKDTQNSTSGSGVQDIVGSYRGEEPDENGCTTAQTETGARGENSVEPKVVEEDTHAHEQAKRCANIQFVIRVD